MNMSAKLKLRALSIILAALILPTGTFAQKSEFEAETLELANAGRLKDNVYSNSHAGFSFQLPQPPCDGKLNTGLDLQNGMVFLFDCKHVVQGWKGMYMFTIFTQAWARYPNLESVAQYVRSVRHAGEWDPKIHTIEPETQRQMAGLEFTETIVSNQIPEGRTYYQGVTCAHYGAYLLCFKAEAPTVEALRELLNVEGKLQIKRPNK